MALKPCKACPTNLSTAPPACLGYDYNTIATAEHALHIRKMRIMRMRNPPLHVKATGWNLARLPMEAGCSNSFFRPWILPSVALQMVD